MQLLAAKYITQCIPGVSPAKSKHNLGKRDGISPRATCTQLVCALDTTQIHIYLLSSDRSIMWTSSETREQFVQVEVATTLSALPSGICIGMAVEPAVFDLAWASHLRLCCC